LCIIAFAFFSSNSQAIRNSQAIWYLCFKNISNRAQEKITIGIASIARYSLAMIQRSSDSAFEAAVLCVAAFADDSIISANRKLVRFVY